jgi:hypothetical protein
MATPPAAERRTVEIIADSCGDVRDSRHGYPYFSQRQRPNTGFYVHGNDNLSAHSIQYTSMTIAPKCRRPSALLE